MQNNSKIDIDAACKIDEFVIYRHPQNSVIAIRGSFNSVPGTLSIEAAINGNRKDSHAFILPQEKGKGSVKHSFEIELIDESYEYQNLQLFLLNGSNPAILIQEFDDQEIKDAVVDNTMIAYVDQLSYADTGVGVVSGWGFSLLGELPEYRILNEEGTEVRISVRRTLQQRLVQRKVVTTEHALCGFIITFEGNKDQAYTLVIRDSSHEKRFLLDTSVSGSSQKTNGILHLFHMINGRTIQRGVIYIRKNGVLKFFKRLTQGITEEIDYDAWFKRNRVTAKELEAQKKHVFSYGPKISILVPTYNTPANLLREMLNSVREQSYGNWELCIADGSDAASEARHIILEYQKNDDRIKTIFLTENYGISGNTNRALSLATGEYTALFDHDDLLEPDALYEIVDALQEKQHDVIYTDEDKLNDKTQRLEDPNFKPDYDKDLLLSHNYITHFFVVKSAIIKDAGGFDSEYDGSQDYDVIFKCIEKADSIHHVAKSLYHWRMHEGSTALDPESKMYCYVAGQKAIQHHLDRIGIHAKVEMQPKPLFGLYHVIYDVPKALVSVVIPNRDHVDVLKRCVDSLFQKNEYQNFEVIIVENNSEEPKTFAYYKELQKQYSNIKVVEWQGKQFNYSAINNYGVTFANGEYLLFLNNDTEIINSSAICEMLGLCAREDVGAVGAKLLHDNHHFCGEYCSNQCYGHRGRKYLG